MHFQQKSNVVVITIFRYLVNKNTEILLQS